MDSKSETKTETKKKKKNPTKRKKRVKEQKRITHPSLPSSPTPPVHNQKSHSMSHPTSRRANTPVVPHAPSLAAASGAVKGALEAVLSNAVRVSDVDALHARGVGRGRASSRG